MNGPWQSTRTTSQIHIDRLQEYLKRVSLKRTPEPFTFCFAGRTPSRVAELRDREFAGTQLGPQEGREDGRARPGQALSGEKKHDQESQHTIAHHRSETEAQEPSTKDKRGMRS